MSALRDRIEQAIADHETVEIGRHAPRFARVRARIFGRSKSAQFGRTRRGDAR